MKHNKSSFLKWDFSLMILFFLIIKIFKMHKKRNYFTLILYFQYISSSISICIDLAIKQLMDLLNTPLEVESRMYGWSHSQLTLLAFSILLINENIYLFFWKKKINYFTNFIFFFLIQNHFAIKNLKTSRTFCKH